MCTCVKSGHQQSRRRERLFGPLWLATGAERFYRDTDAVRNDKTSGASNRPTVAEFVSCLGLVTESILG
jgi:hypothetical protein